MEMENQDGGYVALPPNMALTENSSYTFSTTTSACLDLFFEVMQHTEKEHIVKLLGSSWEENSLLTLKLIFQLRDIRKGKGAAIEFHHCLRWLFKHHPMTLIHNVQHIAQHGYWKDLSWLIKFFVEDRVSMTSERNRKTRKIHFMREDPESSAEEAEKAEKMDSDLSPEELMRGRVNGTVSKKIWRKYLRSLPNDDAKKEAKVRFQSMVKSVHLERHQQAKNEKKAKKIDKSTKLADMMKQSNFAALYNAVVEAFVTALKRDVENLKKNQRLETTALAGKWAPNIDGAVDASTSLGKSIARALFSSESGPQGKDSAEDYDKKAFSAYRKNYLNPLRNAINVPERLMSKRKWSELEYDRVPSVCMKRNKKLFLQHDAERFTGFLEDVKQGKKKIASGALLPHQIVEQFLSAAQVAPELEQVSELQWNSYVENLKKVGILQSALAVCDVSGSMAGVPMVVAIALSLLTAAVSKPPFNSVLCSFSATPSLHRVDQATLKEKVEFTRNMDWGMNTNMQAVFDLILKLARDSNLPRDEMVKTIFIFSDMEFDQCGGNEYETDYQLIKRKYDEAGYELPGIVFWNLRGGSRSKPVTKDEKNVALVSGFSGQMMRTFLEKGEFSSPYQTMIDTLGTHYDHLKVCD